MRRGKPHHRAAAACGETLKGRRTSWEEPIARLNCGNAGEAPDGCSESGGLCRRVKAHGRMPKLWKRSQAPRRAKTLRASR
jgi:hypothetical protein